MNTRDMYALADSLAMTLEFTDKGLIEGSSDKEVDISLTRLVVPNKVVSSALGPDASAILCQSIGNLLVLMVCGYKKHAEVSCFLLDQSKMTCKPFGSIEALGENPKPEDVVAAFKDAIVCEYAKKNKTTWVREK